MYQWSHGAARSAATLTAVWVVSIGAISTGGLSDMSNPLGPNYARALAPAAVVGHRSGLPSYQANATATVLRLGTLVTGEHEPALAGLRLGTATAAADTASHPKALASAAQVTGADGAPAQAAVVQGAGERGRQDGSISRSGSGADLPQLTLGTSRLTANAHWGSTATGAAGPVGISSALARPGELVLHPGSGESLLQVWRGSQGRSQTQLVAVPGQSTLAVRATAQAELTNVTLFRDAPTELTIRFLTGSSLVATATGTDRTGVRYAPPLIAVTAAQGRSYRLGTAGETVDIPLAGPGGCDDCGTGPPSTGVVRISLGGVRERIGHTSVDATATAVRIQVLGVPGVGRLLDTTLGDLKVSARVPLGGLVGWRPAPVSVDEASTAPARALRSGDVASPVGQPQRPQPLAANPIQPPADRRTLPLTGTNVSVLGALGIALLGVGWIIVRATRRPRRR